MRASSPETCTPNAMLTHTCALRRDFLESLDDGTFFSQPPAVPPQLMSSPTYANPVALGVDNPYIAAPATLPATTSAPASEPQPASPERERDKPAEDPAPVVLPAATIGMSTYLIFLGFGGCICIVSWFVVSFKRRLGGQRRTGGHIDSSSRCRGR